MDIKRHVLLLSISSLFLYLTAPKGKYTVIVAMVTVIVYFIGMGIIYYYYDVRKRKPEEILRDMIKKGMGP